MADETAAQPPSDDVLRDLDTSGPPGDAAAYGYGNAYGDGDGDASHSDSDVSYDDVGKGQFFVIDTETGEKDVLAPWELANAPNPIQVVDDQQDGSFDDGLGLDDSDMSITDMSITDASVTPVDDLSSNEDFQYEEDY